MGTPIISSINSLTSNASIMVDEFLKTFVEKLPLFLKDAMHLLKILEDLKVPPNTTLVSIDVENVYSNTPHIRGIEVIGEFFF